MRLDVEGVSHWFFRGAPQEIQALDRVSFTLEQGEVLGITGRSGAGATTLARLVTGLVTPHEGRILLDGEDAATRDPGLGRNVGLLFQRPEAQLFEENIWDDIAYALTRMPGIAPEEVAAHVEAACSTVGLNIDQARERSPFAVSDGEKSKIALAGLLVARPALLILDEPGVGLDMPAISRLRDMIATSKTRKEQSVMILAHLMDPFLSVLDRMIVLEKGRVVVHGPPEDAFTAMADDPELRVLIPKFAMFLMGLRRRGLTIPMGEFRAEILADLIADGRVKKEAAITS